MGDTLRDELTQGLAGSSFSSLVRLIKQVQEGGWRALGYLSFQDFATRYHMDHPGFLKRSQVYDYLRIADRLGPLGDRDLDEIGCSRCLKLAVLAARERLNKDWVARARTEPTTDFERAVARELRGTGGQVSFGEVLDPAFRGLQYGPSNEQGVVFLFGMVAEELGFRVQCVRSEYPDCIAHRRTGDRRKPWELVRIEFEFLSSRFKHSADGADLIVCWEDDRSGKSPLHVLELRSEIKKLPALSPRTPTGQGV
jgi:hypothetical protein